MKKTMYLIGILLILSSKCILAMEDADIWTTLEKSASKYPDEPAVIVFDRLTTVYKETGAAVTNEEILIRFNKDEGAAEYRALHYEFNPRTANIRFLDVKAFKADGETVAVVAQSEVFEDAAPAESIYWNFKTVVCPVPALFEGDALYYRIERRGLNLAYLDDGAEAAWDKDFVPPQPDQFMDTLYFEEHLPLLEKTYVIRGPKTRPLQFATGNGALEASLKFDGEELVYTFSAKDKDAFDQREFDSEYTSAALKLAVASHPSWEMKSKWAYEHNEPQFVISPEMKLQVDKIIAGAKTDEEKMSRLLHWTAEEIRYLGLDMGEGEGHMVHKTDEIFTDRAGVCKDKAAILVSMLRAAGFETYFVMTLAMEQTLEVPADDKFNHGVVAIRNKDASWTFLDPTWAPQDRPLFNPLEQEQPVLVACPEGEGLLHVPYSPPEANPFIIEANTALDADGNATTELKIKTDGYPDSKFRGPLTTQPAVLQPSIFWNLVESLSKRGKLQAFSHTDPRDFTQPIRMNLLAEFPGAAIKAGDKLILTPLLSRHIFNGKRESDYLHLKQDVEKQLHSVELSCTRNIEFHERLTIPSGYEIESPPDPIKIDGPTMSLDYQLKKISDRVLSIDQSIKIKRRVTPADDYADLKDAVDAINKLRKSVIVLVNKSRNAKSPPPVSKLSESFGGEKKALKEEGHIERQSTEFKLGVDGGIEETYRVEARAYTESGRDRFADPSYLWNDKFQRLDVVECVTETAAGSKFPAPKTAINSLMAMEVQNAPDYRGIRQTTASFVGVEYGALMKSTIVRTTSAEIAGELDSAIGVFDYFPIDAYDITVTVPEGKTLSYKLVNTDLAPAIDRSGGMTAYRFHFEKLPAEIPERMAPSPLDVKPLLIFSTAKDWDSVLKKVQADFFDGKPIPEDLKLKVDALIKDKQSDREILQTVIDFVETNYKLIELPARRFFFQTREVDRIFQSGYAYSLDRAKLMAACLEAAGGSLSLCFSGVPGRVDDKVPAMQAFTAMYGMATLNHETILIDLEDAGLQYPELIAHRKAILTKTGYSWQSPESKSADDNLSRMKVSLNIEASGEAKATMSLVGKGLFNRGAEASEKTAEWIQSECKKILEGAKVENFSAIHMSPAPDGLSEYACEFSGKVTSETILKNLVRIRLPEAPGGITTKGYAFTGNPERHNPLHFMAPQIESLQFDIVYPKGWELIYQPPAGSAENPAFASKKSFERIVDESESKPQEKEEAGSKAGPAGKEESGKKDSAGRKPPESRHLRFQKSFQINQKDVPPTEYPAFVKAWNDYILDSANILIFKKPSL